MTALDFTKLTVKHGEISESVFSRLSSDPVLTITPEGIMMRRGKPINDCSKDELIELVTDLVDLFRKPAR